MKDSNCIDVDRTGFDKQLKGVVKENKQQCLEQGELVRELNVSGKQSSGPIKQL